MYYKTRFCALSWLITKMNKISSELLVFLKYTLLVFCRDAFDSRSNYRIK